MNKYEPVLVHFKQKINLTEKEEVLLVSKFKYRTYLKGQYILQGDDINRYQTFILSGKVRTFYLDDKGNEHIIALSLIHI